MMRRLPSDASWEDLLLAWLHDPFDKALDIRGHEQRAARYAGAALDREVSRAELKRRTSTADRLAAAVERLPMPTAGARGSRAVGPPDGLLLIHPASAARVTVECTRPDVDRAVKVIADTVRGLDRSRDRLLALWRLLPDRLAETFGDDAARLPADTRLPDHTLFQHADVTAGLHAALAEAGGAALLSFALGPVQPFIQASRSVRDLWSGSAVLSWLAFQAMTPILNTLGPTAFVYPALRGAPLIDLWLRGEMGLGDRVEAPSVEARKAPSLPNRFVAVTPWGRGGAHAEALREQCLEAARDGWRRLGDSVRARLDPILAELDANWADRWDAQIAGAFEFHATTVRLRDLSDERLARLAGAKEFGSVWPDAAAIRRLGEAMPSADRPGYRQDGAGRWQAQLDYSSRLMAAERTVRHVPYAPRSANGRYPGKCTLFGSWEQLGPASSSGRFWNLASERIREEGVRLRQGERLCAVGLTKRFAGPALLRSELQVCAHDLRFPDTATVAAADWLARAGIDPGRERRRSGHRGSGYWNGQWLHWRQRDQGNEDDEPPVPQSLWTRLKAARSSDRLGGPPSYYAVIAMDGDRLGRWLAGRKTPSLRKLLHPKLRRYFEGLGQSEVGLSLDARRPVSPALHGAISSALATFATEVAPKIVSSQRGVVIYSGGDDVLALCPLATATRCALALRLAFSGEDQDGTGDGWRTCGERRRITMGRSASMSAGLAIVHIREDLRLALNAARDAERRAKDGGRDQLQVVAIRGSARPLTALCPWRFAERLDTLRQDFLAGASSRWTYRLRAELPVLGSGRLPTEALEAEIRRLVDRSRAEGHRSGHDVATFFRKYCELRGGPSASLLKDFVTLCQFAEFLARGRDD